MWRVIIAETVTGRIMADVAARDLPSFARKVTDTGTWTVNVVPDDPANAALDFYTYTDAGRFTWAVIHDEYVVQAGPTFTHSFTENTRTLSVSGTGIQGLFKRRVLRNATGHTAIVNPSEDLTISDKSLRGIAREIVAANMAQTNYELPIDLPAPEPGSNTRTYYGYDLAMCWDRLDELSKVINGPELDFHPYLVPGENRLRWQMRIGGPRLGDQETTTVWDSGAHLGAVNVDSNGSASPAARVWVKGSGSDRALLSGFADDSTLAGLGFPPADYVNGDHTSVIEQATLESLADTYLTNFRRPTETWTTTLRLDTTGDIPDAAARLGNWALGDNVMLGINGHSWIPDGQYRRRVLGYSNNDASSVTLQLQPEPGAL